MRVDTAKALRDIKAPLKAPVTFAEILPYIGIGLLIVLIILAGIYYLRMRKQNKPVVRVKRPPEPAHRIALRELDQLKDEKLWQKNQVKEYYTRLTNIVRKYIEKRFGITALEQTSGEILDSFKKSGSIDNDLYGILEELLQLADLVKFAKSLPMPDENERNLNNAYTFVLRTKPRTDSTEENPEKSISKGSDNVNNT
jgi:hypothetical protein